MLRSLCTLAFCMSFFFLIGNTAETNNTPIETLIKQLNDKQFRIREKAGRALESRGEEALPILRKAVTEAEPEAKRRIEVLTQQLERRVLLGAKRVTVKAEMASVKSVLEQLAKQTGYKIEYQDQDREKISIDMKDVPFWEAMHRIVNDAGLQVNWDAQSDRIMLYFSDSQSPYAWVNGPFYCVAQNISFNKYVQLGQVPRRSAPQANDVDNISFNIMVQSEPKAPILTVGQMRLTQAEDENGLSLVSRNQQQEEVSYIRYYEGYYRNYQHQVSVAMHKPDKDAKTAKIIKGKIPVVLLAQVKPEITFDDMLKVKKKKLIGQTIEITLESTEEQNKMYMVKMQIQRIGQFDSNDNSWMNNIQQKLELQDEKGQKYVSYGASTVSNNTPTMMEATYQFGPPNNGEIGKPKKLLYNQWITCEHEVEFEFKNITLP
jgi:hypothetical protein